MAQRDWLGCLLSSGSTSPFTGRSARPQVRPGESRPQEFRQALKRCQSLDDLVKRYAAVRLRQTAQVVACNALHPATERLCRWLLMSHDRVGRDEFTMTQEFMSELLGVRRPSVSLIAGTLQGAGLITYKRGLIRVKNRRGLEESSCECYEVMKHFYDLILKQPEREQG